MVVPQGRILKIEDHEDIVFLEDRRRAAGGEGLVEAAVYRGSPVALKKYHKNLANRWASLLREVAVMMLMEASPHIVKLVGVFQTDSEVNIVMDFAYNQSLAGLLEAVTASSAELEAAPPISLELRRRIVYDVCRGLRDLHARGIAHEDLKCENVLLDFGLRARICDFGFSAHVDSPFDHKSSGTEGWRSPEKDSFWKLLCSSRAAAPAGPRSSPSEEHAADHVHDILQKAGYDRRKSDIYSLGLIIQKIFSEARRPDQHHEAGCSRITAIIQDCLSPDPDARPSCEQVMEEFRPARLPYSLFSGLEDNSLDDEVGRLNLCYNWTGFDNDEPDAVKQLRNFIFSKQYSQAFDLLHSEPSLAEEYGLLTNVFMGVLSLHGCGCDVDLGKARNNLENAKADAFEDTREMFLVEYYLAKVMLAQDDPASVDTFLALSMKGNAMATAQLAYIQTAKGNSVARHMRIGQEGELDLLEKAARAGHSHAQAQLSLSYLVKASEHAVVADAVVRGDYDRLSAPPYGQSHDSCTPPRDAQAATRSIARATADVLWIAEEALVAAEGGSILGQVIYDVLHDDDLLFNREAQEVVKYPLVCEFLGRLYLVMSESDKALFWFQKAGFHKGIVACRIDMLRYSKDPHALFTLIPHLLKLAACEDNLPEASENIIYNCFPVGQMINAKLYLAKVYIHSGQMEYAYRSVMASKKEDAYAIDLLLSVERDWLAAGGSEELMREKRGMLSADAVHYIAGIYKAKGQTEKGLEWNMAAAEKGSDLAMVAVGAHFLREGNMEEARRWLERAVGEMQSPYAMGILGTALSEGVDDIIKAAGGGLKWCQEKNNERAESLIESANKGDPNMAEFKGMVGLVKLSGGSGRAVEEGVELLRESAQLGLPSSYRELALFYQLRGLPGDLTRLRHWYTAYLRLLCTMGQLTSGFFFTARNAVQVFDILQVLQDDLDKQLIDTCLEQEVADAAYLYERYLNEVVAAPDYSHVGDMILELWCAEILEKSS